MLMSTQSSGEQYYDCIDPSLGSQIWRLDDPTTDPGLKTEIELHVQHCADCRMARSLEHRLGAGLEDGRLTIGALRSRAPAWTAWSTGVGGAALAACLALVFLLPPRMPDQGRVMRGDDEPVVTSPLPDTVILDRTPQLSWTPLDRASSYNVTIREVDGEFSWQGSSDSPDLVVPDEASLPTSARFRVEVTPTPAYLVPEGGLRSSFRTGSWSEFLGFRLGAAQRPILAGALLGGLALLTGLVVGFRTRS